MRIRRLQSSSSLQPQTPGLRPARSANFDRPTSKGSSPSRPSSTRVEPTVADGEQQGRRRSLSDPQRSSVPLRRPETRNEETAQPMLATVMEEKPSNSSTATPNIQEPLAPAPTGNEGVKGRIRAASNATRHKIERGRPGTGSDRRGSGGSSNRTEERGNEYESEVTDFLDVIDPEVSTLTTLNNVQNSLFVPYLGRFYSRQPTYNLTRSPTASSATGAPLGKRKTAPPQVAAQEEKEPEEKDQEGDSDDIDPHDGLYRSHTIKSTLSGMSVGHNYAVLPHGVRLEGWNDEEKDQLNDHVRHLLHSRREGFKRSMRAFRKYVSKREFQSL